MEDTIMWSCPHDGSSVEGVSGGDVKVSVGPDSSLIFDMENYCVLELDVRAEGAVVRPHQPCTSDPQAGSVFETGIFTVDGDTGHLEAGGTQWNPFRGAYYPCPFTTRGELRRKIR